MQPELRQALHQGFSWIQQQNFEAAIPHFQTLLRAYPQSPDVWNGWGLCAEAKQNWAEAENAYQKSLALRPDDPEVLNNLAIFYQQRNQHDRAIKTLKQLLALHPHPYGYYNLAQSHTQTGAAGAALEAIEKALSLAPEFEAAGAFLFDLATDFQLKPQVKKRFIALQKQWPSLAWPPYYLGRLAFQDLELEQAAWSFYQTLTLAPHLEPAYYLLSQVAWRFVTHNQQRKGIQILEHLLEKGVQTAYLKLQLLCISPPAIYKNRDEAHKWRQYFEQELPPLLKARFPISRPMHQTHFYLAYQGFNDRELCIQLSQLHQRFLPSLDWPVTKKKKNPKKRIGFISTYFYQHSVSFCYFQMLKCFLESEFEVYIFGLYKKPPQDHDVFYTYFKAQDHFYELDIFENLKTLTQQLKNHQLDILIYTDIGMDIKTYHLAHYRLATHQMVLPGHPVTTGIANLDYFISPAVLEPANAQDYYSETLVCLPGVPTDYQKVSYPAQPLSRTELGLPEAKHIYLCPMTLFKIHPEFDHVLAQILRQDPQGSLIFFKDRTQYFAPQLWQRFQTEIPDVCARIQFIPWQPRDRFVHYLLQADVILDTFYFGCGNTAYLAFGGGCPIVTWPTEQMRTRGVMGLYQIMDITTPPIAHSPAEYVDWALRLATQPKLRAQLTSEILAKSDRLFHDPTHNQALLDFCRNLLKK